MFNYALKKPEITIIIVNYNSGRFLFDCLSSIGKYLKGLSYEIIIVDNNSSDGSIEKSKSLLNASYILNSKNLGFSRACNQGIGISKGDYVLILNPDIRFIDYSFSDCIKYLRRHKEIGIIGPLLLTGNIKNARIDKACRRSIPTLFSSFFTLIGISTLFPKNKFFSEYHLGHLDYRKIAKVGAINGAFMLIPRKVLAQCKFDNNFFLYAEDLDLCKRISERGYDIVYFPKTRVYHQKDGSGKRFPWSRYYFYRSAWIFYRKHYSKPKRILNILEDAFIFLAIHIVMIISLIIAYLRNGLGRICQESPDILHLFLLL